MPERTPDRHDDGAAVVGFVGVVSAAVMVYRAFRRERSAALRWMIGGLLLWARWAILVDASTHEWGRDMRLVP